MKAFYFSQSRVSVTYKDSGDIYLHSVCKGSSPCISSPAPFPLLLPQLFSALVKVCPALWAVCSSVAAPSLPSLSQHLPLSIVSISALHYVCKTCFCALWGQWEGWFFFPTNCRMHVWADCLRILQGIQVNSSLCWPQGFLRALLKSSQLLISCFGGT